MKIKDNKCRCGNDDFFLADKENQIGIYCSYCGKWLKWANKDEQNLRMKQESVLDKIRAEIDQKQYDFMADKDYDEGIRFGLMLAYQIIDKYKAESEDKG